MVAVATISWLGLLVHNVADLPGQYLTSPETLFPGLLTVLLLVVHRVGPRRVAAVALAGWAGVNLLLGGIASVLPLDVLPFEPEQTVRHYGFHGLHALTQIPLLVAGWREFRGGAVRGDG